MPINCLWLELSTLIRLGFVVPKISSAGDGTAELIADALLKINAWLMMNYPQIQSLNFEVISVNVFHGDVHDHVQCEIEFHGAG